MSHLRSRSGGMKALDDFLPVYEFSEGHRLAIDAPPERIDRALRRLGGGGAGPQPRTADEFLAYGRPDSCKAVIEFRVGASLLSTETRVHVGDPSATRKFSRYWRVIRPFSALIRVLFLRAARCRAEATA